MKRLWQETTEALDLCLERNIISQEQHWCGIHLRWLYTLRHGAPGVRAIDPTHLGGIETKPDDPEWRNAREKEFHDAVRKLQQDGYAAPLLNLCVHNERPPFLRPASSRWNGAHETARTIGIIRNGLDILVTHWRHHS